MTADERKVDDDCTRTIMALEMTGGKRLMYPQPVHLDEWFAIFVDMDYSRDS